MAEAIDKELVFDGENPDCHWGGPLPFDTEVELPSETTLEAGAECEGAIEVINGRPAAEANLSGAKFLNVRGWVFPSRDMPKQVESVYLVLTDPWGMRRFVKTRQMLRLDVADHYKNEVLAGTGYRALADIADITGDYVLSVAFRDAKTVHMCSSGAINVSILQ